MTRLMDRLLRLAARVGLPGATDQDRAEYAAVRAEILAWVERRPGLSVAALIRVHRQIRAAGALSGAEWLLSQPNPSQPVPTSENV